MLYGISSVSSNNGLSAKKNCPEVSANMQIRFYVQDILLQDKAMLKKLLGAPGFTTKSKDATSNKKDEPCWSWESWEAQGLFP